MKSSVFGINHNLQGSRKDLYFALDQHSMRGTAWMKRCMMGFLVVMVLSPGAWATTPSPTPTTGTTLDSGVKTFTAPPDVLKDALDRQLKAANQRDLQGVMATYAPTFKHQDGLDFVQTQDAVRTLWGSHPKLNYSAVINSWEQEGSDLVAVVETQVEGLQNSERGQFNLKGTTQVRNRYQPNPKDPSQLLLVSQEVLKEATTLTSGSAPPSVTMKLPDVVKTGSTYKLEAIVAEPLRANVLLGAVTEEPISLKQYQEKSSFQLEPLQSGGLFRQADAPSKPGSEWVSVMLVGQEGVTLESRRITVTDRLILTP